MEQLIQEKYDKLKRIIIEAGSAAIAFSGGVDSTFLLKVCVDLLGNRALAVTARSETFPARELEQARDLAKQIGGKHVIIHSEELEVPGFSDNPPNRCFLCKKELFSKIKNIAGCQFDTFIHCIINTIIRFTYKTINPVSIFIQNL